mgnify:CR=1 FL=1|jgi:hypothetical protein
MVTKIKTGVKKNGYNGMTHDKNQMIRVMKAMKARAARGG